MSVDCTFGEGKKGEKKKRDRVGIVVVFPGQGATRYVHYAFAKRMGIVDTIAKIHEIYKTFTDVTTGDPMIGKILIEKKANGEAVMELMGNDIAGVVPYEPKGDKKSRANACVPTVEAHNICLLKGAPWIDEFTGELGAFPKGANDDLVDAFTQAITEMVQSTSVNRLKLMCKL
ncbi:unnamed protein product [marine sediment metagenome]|uniref:Terminase large subunit gp17-like C-terminal domain-containing protein n=1 Tax=marine sediment metagenome TaxID=412755 RepID=X0RRY7_9ZZZZ